jgi:hypothetical protein
MEALVSVLARGIQRPRFDRARSRVREEAGIVDEVARLTQETATARLEIQEPVVRRKRSSVDPLRDAEPGAVRSERLERPDRCRRESPVEAHHEPPLGGPLDSRDPVVVADGERERLFDEDRLVGEEGRLHPSRVRVVTGRDEHDLGARILDGGTAVGCRGAKARALPSVLGLERTQRDHMLE